MYEREVVHMPDGGCVALDTEEPPPGKVRRALLMLVFSTSPQTRALFCCTRGMHPTAGKGKPAWLHLPLLPLLPPAAQCVQRAQVLAHVPAGGGAPGNVGLNPAHVSVCIEPGTHRAALRELQPQQLTLAPCPPHPNPRSNCPRMRRCSFFCPASLAARKTPTCSTQWWAGAAVPAALRCAARAGAGGLRHPPASLAGLKHAACTPRREDRTRILLRPAPPSPAALRCAGARP